jgi:colicin import membrane protein
MARQGITFAQVTAAATELTTAGQLVTSRAVRDHLGTGSLTTIQAHLKDWRNNAAEQTPVVRQTLPLPATALTPLEAAFAAVQREAAAPLEVELVAVKQERDDSVEISRELSAELEQAEQDRDTAQAEVARLQGQLAGHERTVATLDTERTARAAAEQRGAAAEARLERLTAAETEVASLRAQLQVALSQNAVLEAQKAALLEVKNQK